MPLPFYLLNVEERPLQYRLVREEGKRAGISGRRNKIRLSGCQEHFLYRQRNGPCQFCSRELVLEVSAVRENTLDVSRQRRL